jgi:hypothetical protein
MEGEREDKETRERQRDKRKHKGGKGEVRKMSSFVR